MFLKSWFVPTVLVAALSFSPAYGFFLMAECYHPDVGWVEFGEVESLGKIEPALRLRTDGAGAVITYDYWATGHGWVVFVKDAKSLEHYSEDVQPVFFLLELSAWRDEEPFTALFRQVQNGEYLIERELRCQPK